MFIETDKLENIVTVHPISDCKSLRAKRSNLFLRLPRRLRLLAMTTGRCGERLQKINGKSMKYFLSVLSMVLIIEGIPYFMFPGRFKELIKILEEMEEFYLRAMGLTMMILGIILLYLTRR